jgi:hypothetical protein
MIMIDPSARQIEPRPVWWHEAAKGFVGAALLALVVWCLS